MPAKAGIHAESVVRLGLRMGPTVRVSIEVLLRWGPSWGDGVEMPELPEVETTVRGLEPVLEGRRLVRVEPRRADLRRAFPQDLRQRLTGARVTGLDRRAK